MGFRRGDANRARSIGRGVTRTKSIWSSMFAADEAPCPSCGARLGGRSGCQAVFEGLAARAWSTRTGQTIPSRGAMTIANLSAPQQSGSIRRSFGDGQTTFGWRAVFSLRWRVNGWMPSAVTAAPERQIGELLMTRSRRRRLATVGVLLMAAPALHAFQLAASPRANRLGSHGPSWSRCMPRRTPPPPQEGRFC